MSQYDEKLGLLQQQVARKRHLTAMRQELEGQIAALRSRMGALRQQRDKEQADVDRLEGRSLASFFYYVVGKKEEQLTRERQEAYAAAVKYDAVARELAAAEEDFRRCEAELGRLDGCEANYDSLLKEKAGALKAAGTPAGEKILSLEERLSWLENQNRELREAESAGRTALERADNILKSLDSAEGWGTFDLLGGGLISDVVKHGHLDEAQRKVEQLQSDLRRFKTELADVTIQADLHVNVDGFLLFADYFFDGLFTDWMVLDQISSSQTQVRKTRSQIEQVLNRLDQMREHLEQERVQLQDELNELVLHTSV